MSELEKYQSVFLSRDSELSYVEELKHPSDYPHGFLDQYHYIKDLGYSDYGKFYGGIIFHNRSTFLLDLWSFDSLGGEREYGDLKKSWMNFKRFLVDAKNG